MRQFKSDGQRSSPRAKPTRSGAQGEQILVLKDQDTLRHIDGTDYESIEDLAELCNADIGIRYYCDQEGNPHKCMRANGKIKLRQYIALYNTIAQVRKQAWN